MIGTKKSLFVNNNNKLWKFEYQDERWKIRTKNFTPERLKWILNLNSGQSIEGAPFLYISQHYEACNK